MPMHTIDFDQFELTAGDRLLDLGCGEGRHAITAYLLEDILSVGVDLSLRDLETTRERYRQFHQADNPRKQLLISVADGSLLPFPDQFFDKVICSEVLEHIPDFRRVLEEINRVLKPGGSLAISVPRFFPEWVCWKLSRDYHSVAGGHIRIFRQRQLMRDIEAFSFIPRFRHWAHALHVPFWWLKCLFWNHDNQDEAWIVRQYRRFLEWDLMQDPVLTRVLEKLLNPVLGKSLVLYYLKPCCRNPNESEC